jgi:biopolymer transport protein ExbB/TolQ
LDWLAVLALAFGVVALALALVVYVRATALKEMLFETHRKLERFERDVESTLNTLKEAVSETTRKVELLENEVNSLRRRRSRKSGVTTVSPETQPSPTSTQT